MVTINEKYILPAGVEVFSIALQETIVFKRDVIVKVTNTVSNTTHLFAVLQFRILNSSLSDICGKDMSSYFDKINGGISVDSNKLIELQ